MFFEAPLLKSVLLKKWDNEKIGIKMQKQIFEKCKETRQIRFYAFQSKNLNKKDYEFRKVTVGCAICIQKEKGG